MGKVEKEIRVYKLQRSMELYKELVTMFSEIKKAEGKRKEELIETSDRLLENELEKQKGLLVRMQHREEGKPWDFSKEKALSVFAENDGICLVPFREEHYEGYFLAREENSAWADGYFGDKDSKDREWHDIMSDYSFPCAVIQKEDGSFAGYVHIFNTVPKVWEISIELLKPYTGKGIGCQSLVLFMNRITELTGKQEYMFRVTPDNIACQKMMSKLNARLIGLHNYYFADEEEAKQFGETHRELITDQIKHLAGQMDVSTEEVISHVLEYRLDVGTGKAASKGKGTRIPVCFTQGADPEDVAEAVAAFVNEYNGRLKEKEIREKGEIK